MLTGCRRTYTQGEVGSCNTAEFRSNSASLSRIQLVRVIITQIVAAEICKHQQRCTFPPCSQFNSKLQYLHKLHFGCFVVIIAPQCVWNNGIKPAKGPFALPDKRWCPPPTPVWSGRPGPHAPIASSVFKSNAGDLNSPEILSEYCDIYS